MRLFFNFYGMGMSLAGISTTTPKYLILPQPPIVNDIPESDGKQNLLPKVQRSNEFVTDPRRWWLWQNRGRNVSVRELCFAIELVHLSIINQ